MIYEKLYINYKIEQDNTKLGFICDAANKKQRETVDAWSKGNYWNKIENPCVGEEIDKAFKSIFPTIHNFIKLYKKEHDDYKVLAYDLQKAESDLIFNKIIKRIINTHPHIKMITIHDSIVIPKKDRDIASIIFQDELVKEFDLI